MKEINSDGICPEVLLEIYRTWKSLKQGEEEEVIVRTKWESSIIALEKWCNETGNIFLGHEKYGNTIVIRLKLKK